MRSDRLRSQIFAMLILVCIHPGSGQGVFKTMLRLPDTGQDASFTNTPGEDSDYKINPPFFLVPGDGTVIDTVTGLMWQQSDGGEMSFESAENYCQNLILGGFSDWRLPNAQEAFSILNHGRQNPPLDPAVFPNSGAEYWWTSELQAGNASKVWVTNAGGGIGNHPKAETVSAGGTKKFHARAVRDVAPPVKVSAQYTDMDSVVMDNLTGLEWTRFSSRDSLTWENALLFAENLVMQGKSDWRLPNIKELESLNDETRSQPSVNPGIFQDIGTKKYWSGTSLPSQQLQAWFMNTGFGVISHELKTTKNNVLCVRGPSQNTTGLSDHPERAIRVFPNPFKSHIRIEANDPTDLYQLFDSFGHQIFIGHDISNEDFSELPPGLYFLNVTGTNRTMFRLLKI